LGWLEIFSDESPFGFGKGIDGCKGVKGKCFIQGMLEVGNFFATPEVVGGVEIEEVFRCILDGQYFSDGQGRFFMD
jgi:hypothetical protein